MIEIVEAKMDHVADLAPRLRTLPKSKPHLAAHPATSSPNWLTAVWSEALVIDGRIEAIGGLGTLSMMFGPGIPWLIGSDRVTECRRWFLDESRRQVGRMLGHFQRLENRVDARIGPAIRNLRWLGFTLGPSTPWGDAGLPFHPFTMERH